MENFLHTFAAKIIALFSGALLLFTGGYATTKAVHPSAQPASVVAALQDTTAPIEAVAPQTPVALTSNITPFTQPDFITKQDLSGILTQFSRVVALLPYVTNDSTAGSVTKEFFDKQTIRTQDSMGDAVHDINDSLNGYLPLEGGTIAGDLSVDTFSVSGSATTTAQNGFNIAQGCFAVNGSCLGLGSFGGLLSVSSGGTGWANINSGSILFGNGSSALATSSSLFWDNANGRLGIGTTVTLAPLQIGNGNVNNSVESQVLISRRVDDTSSGNAHAFSDSSTITRSGAIGYNSYDARIAFSGTQDYDHYAAFQAAPSYGSSGTMTNYYGLFSSPVLATGAVTNSYGVYLQEGSGAAVVTRNYGLYMSGMTRGTNNYGIGFHNLPSNGTIVSDPGINIAIMPGDVIGAGTIGRVGINTVSPAMALDVKVVGGGQEIIRGTQSGGSNRSAGLGIDGAGNFYGAALYDNGTKTFVAENGGIITGAGYMSSNAPTNGALIQGNVGIGTTSPWRTLSVAGTVAFAGLTSDTADQKALCLTAAGEVVANTGSSCITSSQRFKNNIQPLDGTSGLAEIMALSPVSFDYKPEIGIFGTQVGFIAEQVQQIDPRLVVLDASNTPFTVRYENLTAILAKAIQEIASISGAFRDNLIAWLGDAGNGIVSLFAQNGHFSNELCVGTTCVTPAQFEAMVAASGQTITTFHESDSTEVSTASTTETNSADSLPATTTNPLPTDATSSDTQIVADEPTREPEMLTDVPITP